MFKFSNVYRYHRYICLTVFIAHLTFSSYSAVILGTLQSNWNLHIPFRPVYSYFERNSYTLVPIFGTYPLLSLMIYLVHCEVSVLEGDFFGMLGLLLFFCLISFYGAVGTTDILSKEDFEPRNPYLNNCLMDERLISWDEYDWVNAWSNRPTCMRMFIERKQKKLEQSKKEIKKVGLYFAKHGEIVRYMGTEKNQSVKSNGDYHHHGTLQSRLRSENSCDTININQKVFQVSPKFWMHNMHRTLKCCGPLGIKYWNCLYPNNTDCSYQRHLKKTFKWTHQFKVAEGLMYLISLVCFTLYYVLLSSHAEKGGTKKSFRTSRMKVKQKRSTHNEHQPSLSKNFSKQRQSFKHRMSSSGSLFVRNLSTEVVPRPKGRKYSIPPRTK